MTDQLESRPRPARGRHRRRRSRPLWIELPIALVVAVVLAVLVKSYAVQAFYIPSGSMEQTLHGCDGCTGDRVLVNKMVYRFHDPKPGDVIVFRGPPSWLTGHHVDAGGNVVSNAFRSVGRALGMAEPLEEDFVKRVIAVGGQRVECCDDAGRVQVDGKPLTEPYIYQNSPRRTGACPVGRAFGPVVVPEGRLWVMGDHRGSSADSRCHVDDKYQGTIAVDDVIGKAFAIIWPPGRWGGVG